MLAAVGRGMGQPLFPTDITPANIAYFSLWLICCIAQCVSAYHHFEVASRDK